MADQYAKFKACIELSPKPRFYLGKLSTKEYVQIIRGAIASGEKLIYPLYPWTKEDLIDRPSNEPGAFLN